LIKQASLKSHNASFDSLLRVIPAKYYLRPDSDDEEQVAKPTVRSLDSLLLQLSLVQRLRRLLATGTSHEEAEESFEEG
jgi:hypothetical protein